MEPLSPQDPLSKLLGKAKAVESRPNFTQNVMRSVRQLPQGQTVWERMSEWFDARFSMRPVLTAACAALLAAAMTGYWLHEKDGIAPSNTVAIVENSPAPSSIGTAENDVAAALDQMEQLSILLAQQDTRSMSDSDLALLLY